MQFVIAAVALAALSQTVGAIPMGPSATAIKPISDGMTDMAATFPVRVLERVERLTNTTAASAGPGVHPDAARAMFPATLLLCTTANCAGCFTFNLATLPIDKCLTDSESTFTSVAISQPSGEGLPFAVAVSPANGCASGFLVSRVNECLNTNGEAFSEYVLIG